MPKIKIDEADDLTVRDVLHATLSTLDATATVADARAYFAASTSRRLAFVTDDGRYVGSLTRRTSPPPRTPSARWRRTQTAGPPSLPTRPRRRAATSPC